MAVSFLLNGFPWKVGGRGREERGEGREERRREERVGEGEKRRLRG